MGSCKGDIKKNSRPAHQDTMKPVCLFSHVVILAFTTCVANGGIPSLGWISDAKTPVKNVYLDFDNTLTVDGFSEVVRNAFCKTEKYPDCFCGEMCNDTMGLVNTLYEGTDLNGLPFDPVANLTHSFGGSERVTRIKGFLNRLRSKNGNIKIVSTSWAPVSEEQWKEYLINVTGTFNLGFDEDSTLSLEDPGPGKSADKGAVIQLDMTEEDIEFSEALFADDSTSNIKSAKAVCNTLLLPKRRGLDGTDCAYMEALVSLRKVLAF